MNASHPIDGGSPDEQAAQWIARRGAGWTPAEAAACDAWRARRPEHAAAFARAEATEKLLSRLPASPAAAAFLEELEALTAPRTRFLRFRAWAEPAAAAAVVILLLAVGGILYSTLAPYEAAYVTADGTTQDLVLPDESRVTLAEASALEIRYTRGERHLQLTRGEAEFDVAKDPGRPFLVSAGDVAVIAVGTAFKVRHHAAHAVEVIVAEGQVRVSELRHGATAAALRDAPGVLLAAGERLQWDHPATGRLPTIERMAPAALAPDRADVPRLTFADTPLVEAVEQFNRYSAVQIELADAALAARTVGGHFSADAAESFAALLAANGDILIERPSPNRIVLRQAP